jgi:hypothetical protein
MFASTVLLVLLVHGTAEAQPREPSKAAGSAASASPDPRSKARALGEEGLLLFRGGDFAAALGRFDEASALVAMPTLGVRAARCLERLGRWREALERYRATSELVVDEGLPTAFAEAQRAAKEEATEEHAALARRVPTLVLRVVGDAPDAIEIDGAPLAPSSVGAPIPSDPGVHVLLVRWGERVVRRTFDAQPESSVSVELTAPDVVQPVSPRIEAQVAPAPPPVSPAPMGDDTPGRGLATAGAILLGASGLATVVGFAAWGVAVEPQAELDRLCASRACSARALGADGQDALSRHDVAVTTLIASFSIAGALAAGGVSLLVPGLTLAKTGWVSLRFSPTEVAVHAAF